MHGSKRNLMSIFLLMRFVESIKLGCMRKLYLNAWPVREAVLCIYKSARFHVCCSLVVKLASFLQWSKHFACALELGNSLISPIPFLSNKPSADCRVNAEYSAFFGSESTQESAKGKPGLLSWVVLFWFGFFFWWSPLTCQATDLFLF